MKAARSLAIAVIAVTVVGRSLRRVRDLAAAGEVRYRVPQGQDPAALRAKLRVAGVKAHSTADEGDPVLVISTTADTSRERVREILTDAPLNVEGDPRPTSVVTFDDES